MLVGNLKKKQYYRSRSIEISLNISLENIKIIKHTFGRLKKKLNLIIYKNRIQRYTIDTSKLTNTNQKTRITKHRQYTYVNVKR